MLIDDAVSRAKKEKKEKLLPIDSRAKSVLLRKKMDVVELANYLDCSPHAAEHAVKRLKHLGYNVRLAESGKVGIERTLKEGNKLVVNSKDFFDGEWFKFGVLGETHLCSKYAREDVLGCLYDIYAREKIRTVWHTGNIVDGECRFNKYDLIVPSGFEAQAKYLADNYPKRKGIKTKFITGDDHEGWWIAREGINVGERLQQTCQDQGREDLEWIGHMEVDIYLKAPRGQAWMRIVHPGGGTAYAISYATQKLVESYQGGEKPHILIAGHWHKFEQGYPREVHVLQSGCVEDQTPFMRKKKLQAHVGGCIVRYHQADTGEINRFSVEWIPFYDKKFYEGKGKYRRW